MSGNSVINTNLKSLIAQDSSNINNRKLSTAMERLSTGNKINSAKDDAAGLAISTRMDSQIRGLNMAVKNAYDTVSLTETAEGAMEEVTNMLQRMRELALQAANDTNSDLDRRYIQDEIDQLAAEIDRVSDTTQFNSINVLDGSYNSKVFQIGSNEASNNEHFDWKYAFKCFRCCYIQFCCSFNGRKKYFIIRCKWYRGSRRSRCSRYSSN